MIYPKNYFHRSLSIAQYFIFIFYFLVTFLFLIPAHTKVLDEKLCILAHYIDVSVSLAWC